MVILVSEAALASALLSLGFGFFLLVMWFTNSRIACCHRYLLFFGLMGVFNGMLVMTLIVPTYAFMPWAKNIRSAMGVGYLACKIAGSYNLLGRRPPWLLWAPIVGIAIIFNPITVGYELAGSPLISLTIGSLAALAINAFFVYSLLVGVPRHIFCLTAAGVLLWLFADVVPVSWAWVPFETRHLLALMGKFATFMSLTWAHWDRLHEGLARANIRRRRLIEVQSALLLAENGAMRNAGLGEGPPRNR